MGNGRGEHVTHFCVPTPRCESRLAFLLALLNIFGVLRAKIIIKKVGAYSVFFETPTQKFSNPR